jgi:YrbI family 3-deoxy-D-manno-octulosonate 8-phosphate phosphatase
MVVRAPNGRTLGRAVALRARKICVVALDVDGVLTDGRIQLDARGRESRSFHAQDRVAIALLTRAGIHVVALTARRTSAVPAYARNLRIAAVLQGAGQGLASIQRFCRRRRLDLDRVAYVGHDVLDLPLLTAVGLAITVADGADHAKREAHWVTRHGGGGGVVREVGERILRAQGKWASTLGEIWRRWD